MNRIIKSVLFVVLCFCTGAANAQQVRLLSLNQLEGRIKMGKDTLFVINFWATWCSPCVAELPYFEKLQSVYKGQPLKVLLVSLDFKSKLEKEVKPFIKKKVIKNEVFLLNETNQQAYIDRISKNWSGAIPATLFVNTGKNIRKFYEKEFTYGELEQTYKTLK